MPIIFSPTKLLAVGVVLLLLVATSLFAGWHIRGWHDDAAQLKKTQDNIAAINQQMTGVVTASNQLADTITRQNKATDASIAEFTLSLGAQDHAIAQIRSDIQRIPVGVCRFTPDADSLYQRAYATAFGDPAHQTSASGKAGVGHAGYPAAPTPDRHQ